MRFSIIMELWTILTALAAIVAAITCVVINSRLSRLQVTMERLVAGFNMLGTNLGGVGTVIRSQEEAIKASRNADAAKAASILLGEDQGA